MAEQTHHQTPHTATDIEAEDYAESMFKDGQKNKESNTKTEPEMQDK